MVPFNAYRLSSTRVIYWRVGWRALQARRVCRCSEEEKPPISNPYKVWKCGGDLAASVCALIRTGANRRYPSRPLRATVSNSNRIRRYWLQRNSAEIWSTRRRKSWIDLDVFDALEAPSGLQSHWWSVDLTPSLLLRFESEKLESAMSVPCKCCQSWMFAYSWCLTLASPGRSWSLLEKVLN